MGQHFKLAVIFNYVEGSPSTVTPSILGMKHIVYGSESSDVCLSVMSYDECPSAVTYL